MDNAPRWDAPLDAVEGRSTFRRRDIQLVDPDQRPVEDHYARYAYLVHLNAERDFAAPTPQTWPFLVQDATLLAILLQAERDLFVLGQMLGRHTDAGERSGRLALAIEEKLHDRTAHQFVDCDLVSGEHLMVAGLFGYLPLYAGLGGHAVLGELLRALDDPTRLKAPFRVPTLFVDSPDFEARRYWRGPCWVNTNWFLIRALRRHGAAEQADAVIDATLELALRSGFREYYDPLTGEGLGGEQFGWSAALVLDLLAG